MWNTNHSVLSFHSFLSAWFRCVESHSAQCHAPRTPGWQWTSRPGPGPGEAPGWWELRGDVLAQADQDPLRRPPAVQGRVLPLQTVQPPDGGAHTCPQPISPLDLPWRKRGRGERRPESTKFQIRKYRFQSSKSKFNSDSDQNYVYFNSTMICNDQRQI